MADKSSLAEELKSLLADVVTVYFQAHGYHWNVEGSDFSQYHTLFGDISADLYESIDPLAENIRKIGDYAPLTLSKFIDLRKVDFDDVKPDPKAMAEALLKSNEELADRCASIFETATEDGEQGIANFLADRQDMHKKWVWFLTASTK